LIETSAKTPESKYVLINLYSIWRISSILCGEPDSQVGAVEKVLFNHKELKEGSKFTKLK
jgi:hypothetical protein